MGFIFLSKECIYEVEFFKTIVLVVRGKFFLGHKIPSNTRMTLMCKNLIFFSKPSQSLHVHQFFLLPLFLQDPVRFSLYSRLFPRGLASHALLRPASQVPFGLTDSLPAADPPSFILLAAASGKLEYSGPVDLMIVNEINLAAVGFDQLLGRDE